MSKMIYSFNEGNATLRSLLGGKGANLAEMTNMGLPVPGGFTITTDVCNDFIAAGNTLSEAAKEEIKKAITALEKESGKELNSPQNPLLVSVRSGAAVSMPGMMDTILNLGLNDQSVEGLSSQTNNTAFAYDCYRRLLQMFGEVVFEIDKRLFDVALSKAKRSAGVLNDSDLNAEQLKALCEKYKKIYLDEKQKPFPQDPQEQLILAVEAVFLSWGNPRAVIYRDANAIPQKLGTAVTIQIMVFGNSGNTSGTGVLFSRNPANGDPALFGEFLLNAQGEDVVAGIRTPAPIIQLRDFIPAAYHELEQVCDKLEKHFKDMQDVEFTIEQGVLYLLQTRSGKRTGTAALNIASDLVDEGILTPKEAVLSIEPALINQLLHPVFSKDGLKGKKPVTKGLPASPGAACGAVCFNSSDASALAATGQSVIMIRTETSPDDIEGTIASEAVVTSRGGMTSHAAVVARGLGKCCVASCEDLEILEDKKIAYIGIHTIGEGDIISVDGTTGEIYLGEIPTVAPTPTNAYNRIMAWANEYRQLKVYANADSDSDLNTAIRFGAEGVGLARTEHMFFERDKLHHMRVLILSGDQLQRDKALKVLLDIQIKDFTKLYKLMPQAPITIRLLDPPLHEFLPTLEHDVSALARDIHVDIDVLRTRISDLHEVNPMLGHRGCRIGITSPEIYAMQVEAIITSALQLTKEGLPIKPEIMVPLVGTVGEIQLIRQNLVQRIEQLFEAAGQELEYNIGTMIETPRACLVADQIAEEADFFSFGTNDLTQMTFGFSRDDIGKFIGAYIDQGILPRDPFQVLDQGGVGTLMKQAIVKGRKVKKDLSIGVCGEVGGDPDSIQFFHDAGLNYVSCSPYRIPIALLSAAQAALRSTK